MKTKSGLNAVSLWLLMVMGVLAFTQCTKETQNASQLDRQLSATDSTIFAQFYDETVITTADAVPGINDVIKETGVASIIQNRCATVNCHGGAIAPSLTTYNDIKGMVTAGNPEASQLFKLVTTNNFHEAMPPVYAGELTTIEKVTIYNWIKNGANEKPTKVEEFRPTVMKLIVSGCASVQCHNAGALVGDWARRGWVPVASGDTTNVVLTNLLGVKSNLAVMNAAKTTQYWKAYKDSVRKFYADTINNVSFKPIKTVTRRSPFNNYDDVLLDIWFPKGARANKNYLNNNDCFMRRIDSTLIYTNQITGVSASASGNMTWDDSHWTPSEIALFKAWYFADTNIPDAWKYGAQNQSIFKYAKSQNKILKK